MWVLGLYKLSWPANGSFVYVNNFFFFFGGGGGGVIFSFFFFSFWRGKTGMKR